MLVAVPYYQVPLVWDQVEPLIQTVYSESWRFTLPDLYRALVERDMQLWASRRGDKIEAIAITMIRPYPRTKAAMILAISGDSIDHWLKFEEQIATWAQAQGCEYLEAIGARRGWLKKAPQWRQTGIIMERKLAPAPGADTDGQPKRRRD